MEPIPSEVIARRLYAALDGRDRAALAGLVDDASVLHVAGTSGLAGDYQGEEAMAGLLYRMAELARCSLRYGAARLAADAPGGSVLVGRASATRRGRRLDSDVEVTARIDGGVVREAWLSFVDQAACDRFWA
jgi:ketosteroid isomerase-like protein